MGFAGKFHVLCWSVVILTVLSTDIAQAQTNRVPLPQHSIYLFTPLEEQPAGTIISTGVPASRLLASDPDGDTIEFIIPSNSINSQYFSVNSSTGQLSFRQELDREVLTPNNEAFDLFVLVSDNQFNGAGIDDPSIEVRIVLQDINDNHPVVNNLPSTVTIAESADVPTDLFTVESMDADFGLNAQLEYYIAAVNGEQCDANSTTLPCSMFEIDLATGMVSLTSSLDYDVPPAERLHRVSVRVQDNGDSPLSTVRDLSVAVSDVNDLNPAFTLEDYAVDVHENLTFGASVIRVVAFDQDTGINDDIIYSITSGNLDLNGNASFAIDNVTGVIFVNTDILDRETHQEYNLVVLATEAMDSANTDTARVKITVFDINDHAPFFEQSFYSANVSEGAMVGTPVVIVTAIDRDAGVHADFTFSLVDASTSAMSTNMSNVTNTTTTAPLPFNIVRDVTTGRGTIMLSSRVDFEMRQEYSFMVVATETINNTPMSGVTMVTVTVLNENDNNPLFDNATYTATIPENSNPGAFVEMVRALDDDLGSFGGVVYSIVASSVGGSDFNITSDTGRVETAVSLDFESRQQYTLQILAEDLDQNPSTRNMEQATLIVDVINLNDNGPQFIDVAPQINVTEEQTAPVIVYTIAATDADGSLTPLTFEIVDGNELGAFEIVGDNLVTTRELDFDLVTINQTYTLRLVVNDTQETDDLIVVLRVIDINDNSPVFDNITYSFSVYENVPVGTVVGRVEAEDIDSGSFGTIVYSISGPGSDRFSINETTGLIYTAAELDREVRPTPFELVVTATDQDEDVLERNSGSSQLTITILDRNDNAPEFEETTYVFQVSENTDFLVGLSVMATDIDQGTNSDITYIIQNGNEDSTFVIDPVTGVISRNTSVYLDHERITSYTLNVTANDGGTPVNYTPVPVIINILDQNDVVPTFDQTEYESTIREDLQSNSIVRQLVAVDDDSDENGQLTYAITSVSGPVNAVNAPDGTFIIDESTGTIRTSGVFDREAFEGPYTIMVLVRDGGFPVSHNSTTSLLVYISDANDNRPIFMIDQYSNSLSENLPSGELVATVIATDRDMINTNNSEIYYSISDVFVAGTLSDLSAHFSINSTTGVVTTNVSLDYEDISSYRITVVAADRGEPQRSSNAFVLVTVLDENDQPPEFSQVDYTLDVAEDTPINTRFQLLSAVDMDTAPNAIITYTSSLASPFLIDPSSGELILTSTLDFETNTEYSFNVTATNAVGGVVFNDSAEVVISVLDVNDQQPVFDTTVYMTSLPEGNYTNNPSVLGIMIEANDQDSGNLGNVSFDLLLPSDLWEVRTIGNGRGQLVAIGFLDRESVDNYVVTVQAKDGGVPAATATAVVRIDVLDVNDIVPQLDRDSYIATVVENSTPGQVIARVSVMDGDAGSNGEVLLSIDDTVNFNISQDSGEIITRTQFNYEAQQVYTVIITASDNATSGQLSSTATLTVNITDANDNAPIFQTTPIPQSLSEGIAVGTVIATLTASDLDSGSNGQVIYQLSNDGGQFSIDDNGAITISSSLDREVTDKYNITITALDRGQPQMSDVVFLPITVTDENDVPADFQRDAYNFIVPENEPTGTVVGTVVAMDTDTFSNRVTVFDIVEGDTTLFRVLTLAVGQSSYHGNIENIRTLDYESESSYNLRVRGRNTASPGWETFTNVTISISDLNDNRPEFSMSPYSLTVSEAAPIGTPVGTLVATDNDGGINGTVMYSFSPTTSGDVLSLFSLDNATGILMLAGALDFETNNMHSFVVMATDLSVDPMSSSVDVTVSVQDTNENAPMFDRPNYSGTVNENEPAGSLVELVAAINATEQDATRIEYSIVTGGLGQFLINPNTGLITTNQPLDREQQDRYILTVQARDTSTISLSSFAQVDVSVSDVNDETPMFLDPLQFFIREDSSAGTVIGSLVAVDRDAGINGQLTFSSPNTGSPFTVRDNGDIVVSDPSAINFETTPTLNIVVTVTDNAPPSVRLSSSASVTISLIDVNDNSPVFEQPSGYTVTVTENSDVGVSVLTVRASDDDGDVPVYTIVSGVDPVSPEFRLNSVSGLIETTVNTLDREGSVDAYTLTIEADDTRGRTTIVVVTLIVGDANDHAPLCDENPFMFEVDEAGSNTVRLGQVTTSDNDAGNNAVVRYSITSGDPNGQFTVNANTGDVFGLVGLDFETTPNYILGISAIDQSSDPRDRMTSTCLVEVNLRDVNDIRPMFVSSLYEANVVENATMGEVVIQVTATDLDSGINGEVLYFFQTPLREFSIDSSTGVVTVSGSLDAETQPTYDLQLEVRDRGTPTRIGQGRLVIRILDINDNSPRFDRSFFSLTVREDQPMNSDVMTFEASDPDSPVLMYSIEAGNDELYFKINPSSGLVQTARELDRETVAVFTLQVAARDEDGNIGTTTVQIGVLDVNDEAPQFLEPSYSASVPENSPTGAQVLPVVNGSTIRIEAFDSDEPNTQNSRVLYSLEGTDADLFDIDFNTGIVTVARGANLDHETMSMISVTVVASDSVVAPGTRSSTVELVVEVLDENDESPLFSQPFGYAIPVSEGTAVNQLITTSVRASDPDGGSGGVVRYSITGSSPLEAADWFMIDAISGDITLVESLDREMYNLITLTVTGSDQGQPALMSTVSVQVTISDVNDNAPRFTQEIYTTTVPEFLAVGSSAFQVFASDPDVGTNAEVRFEVNPPNNRFTINPSTGVVTSTGPLDHETQDRHSFEVQACDSGMTQLCSRAVVVINVGDFNDETPLFDLPVYSIDICDDTIQGTLLVRPVATDRDSGTNALITYTLVGDVWGLFTIGSASGLISLQRDVDDLDIAETFELVVTATDGGDTPLSGSTILRLRVLNCTAQTFNFESPYNYIEIMEGDRTFSSPPSTNVEVILTSSNFGAVFFSPNYPENPLNNIQNFVNLKSSTELAIAGIGEDDGLDREVRELYTLILQAEDNSVSRQTAFASITVRVLDRNDNAPQFESELYVFSARENTSAPLNVGVVTATDRDQGPNANVTYSILPAINTPYPFAIDPSTGQIYTTTELDRESDQMYNLTVQASDEPGMVGRAQVIINVEDINDCDPMFTQTEYNVPVLENLPAGSSVAMVMAEDCDIGSNAVLMFTIVAGDIGVFSLDGESGVVTTLMPLDFEQVNSYYLSVRVTDMGSPPRSSFVDVNILVEDFNDCPPQFINVPSSRTIFEDQLIGSVLVTFEVSDCDSGNNGVNGTRYNIIAGNADGLFELNSESGVLFTTGSLDREQVSTYLLSVQAQDSAGVNSLSSVTQLSINVGDVNDNDPLFSEQEIFITIGENEDINTGILVVTATDSDQGLNGDVLYSLLNDDGVFDVDEGTGSISLVTSLDRETTDSYNLTVIARDRGDEPRTSNLTIFVSVRDINDNSPAILNVTSGLTMVNIIEGTLSGTPVFTVQAIDVDQGVNGEVSFSLEDLSANLPFEISPTGGVISVTGELDYERQNEYTVVIIATDNGSPQRLSAVATLTINIDDSNDNPPMFTAPLYVGSQEEGMATGTSIVVVIATDADQTGTPNAAIEYSISGGDVEFFDIDATSGVISNRVILDRENRSSFSLTVLANNSASHTPLYSGSFVEISVSDLNDEIPIFDSPTYSVPLGELTPTGSPVITVTANDEDEPDTANSDLVFSLATQRDNPFAIDPNTGEVVLLNSLDFESNPGYNLTLVVEDKGTPRMSSQAQLIISVNDENDVIPFFTETSYSVGVSEGISSFPYRVVDLRYNDGDTLTSFRQSTFSILAVEPSSPGLFYIETYVPTETGAVFMNNAVDFERVQSYTLTLSVENVLNGSGAACQVGSVCTFSQTTSLDISIIDENDNTPVFSTDFYSGEVSSAASTGTSILSVLATDDDAGDASGTVRYDLESSITLPFRIQEVTGTLLTRGLLSEIPSGSEFNLIVSAVDNNGVAPSNTAQATIRIIVLDDFDRIAFDFLSGVDCVVRNEQYFADYLGNVTGYTIVIESYLEYATADRSLYIIHALDENNVIIDFAQFTDRIRSVEAEIFQLFAVCNLTRIISFAEAEEPYEYPPLVDTQTIVILVLCLLLIIGSSILLVMALTQRYLALNNARHKLLADVFYGGSPGSGSVVDNVQQENYQLETLELSGKQVNRQNPMFVHPYDNWAGVDTSGVESVEGASSLQRDNPLYESQEIRMEMFADIHSEDEEADDAELLAQAIADDEDDEDEENAVTAI